jgi:hypothetical protein
VHGAPVRALRAAPPLRELEDEPAEAPAEPPEPYGPIAIEAPAPLASAAIEGDYEGPAILATDIVVQSPPASDGRGPDPFDATAKCPLIRSGRRQGNERACNRSRALKVFPRMGSSPVDGEFQNPKHFLDFARLLGSWAEYSRTTRSH